VDKEACVTHKGHSDLILIARGQIRLLAQRNALEIGFDFDQLQNFAVLVPIEGDPAEVDIKSGGRCILDD